jgi:hypothetical protein
MQTMVEVHEELEEHFLQLQDEVIPSIQLGNLLLIKHQMAKRIVYLRRLTVDIHHTISLAQNISLA